MNLSKVFVGNDHLHLLTASGYTNLRVDLKDFDGGSAYAEYAQFTIGDAASNYIMHCGGYSGTSGKKQMKTHVKNIALYSQEIL